MSFTKTDDGWIGWKEPDNSIPIKYTPQGYKRPSDCMWEHKFTNRPVYGRNYQLVYPNSLEKQPKNQFILNPSKPYAFENDGWVKP